MPFPTSLAGRKFLRLAALSGIAASPVRAFSTARAFAPPPASTSSPSASVSLVASAPQPRVPVRTLAMAAPSSNADGGGKGGLFLFDFDGVVCDSCDECTVSALRTCQRLGAIDGDDGTMTNPPEWLFDKMREIRPAIEVGWQIPVLLSVFLNQRRREELGGEEAMTVEEIIRNYESLVEKWLERYSKTEADMIEEFGSVRDSWIADDLNSWLDINTFYPGVPAALTSCAGEKALVTTKQHRFALALCRHAGVNEGALPDDDVYGLGMYAKKSDVIVDRMAKGGYSPRDTRFFEDRWPTLVKCLADERLNDVRLYLCSWGYVTKEELEMAQAEPRVEVISLDDFSNIVGS
eukprot:CAMPEP_0183309422 /NCGR_PEP_ID=MMETSP0160_2-20130417/25332_1 /TAXON_ID=2839 ORGANISM="Odontella Sinensis, Strain Grunow 1884" /NCGR_SAMPLE_ID=MMETSP0160_2 /ASSEMBLY_ACC=CAM_ASM_000250 /LENGTH=349 /DNA_ID=CAMNT_0025473449 /DNA_START=45 /DNA_END=1094 /DNA_ORIENTATION=-